MWNRKVLNDTSTSHRNWHSARTLNDPLKSATGLSSTKKRRTRRQMRLRAAPYPASRRRLSSANLPLYKKPPPDVHSISGSPIRNINHCLLTNSDTTQGYYTEFFMAGSYLSSSSLAFASTLSTVKPNLSASTLYGPDAPK